MLLGRNKKGLRVAAAFLVRGLYDNGDGEVLKVLTAKMQSLKGYGVNSQEFIAVLAYVIRNEAEL